MSSGACSQYSPCANSGTSSPCAPTAIDAVTGSGCAPCQMPCKFIQGHYTESHPVCMQVYYPQCPTINVQGLCNPHAGAYLPSITVCSQRLWSF